MSKPPINKPKPGSITQTLIRLGIPRRSFYNVREELEDIGAEHTFDDIVEVCRARMRK